ncbi:MAG: hypothetical protein JJT94_11205 [Bernardetiaceae bacterium]|nr:hypothetical protein [Bernardetiaceae bacterium]
MNPKQLVKISNIIGIIAIVLLIYWTFSFILIEVFGLKVFRQNMTESFYFSVFGILALMAGALMINIMFNLTRIAEKHNADLNATAKSKKIIYSLIFLFPLIAIVLFGGDYLTSKKKENMLISSAKYIIENNTEKSEKLLDYKFDEKYINQTSDILQLFSKTDQHFPSVEVITKDSIDNSPVFLGFSAHYYKTQNDTIPPQKKNFMLKTTQPEREYLNQFFNGQTNETRYSSYNGKYELFYPYVKGDKRIILYFSERQRYGKIGS